jgi:hypothetical protein
MSGWKRRCLAAAFGALVVAPVVVLGAAEAQTPTPTASQTASPTGSPPASPSPTPYAGPNSTITIRFVRGGQPVTVSVLQFSPRITADGIQCPVAATEFSGSQYSIPWPLILIPEFPIECRKGPPTTLKFEFGSLAAEFVWTGASLTVDIEVPPSAATPSPSPPAVGLPVTGGRPQNALMQAALIGSNLARANP